MLQPPDSQPVPIDTSSRRGLRLLRLAARAIESASRRRLLACVIVGLFAVGLRVAILPLRPIPFPQLEDEFSYLLQGETFAMGRLTNPTHPLWPFFETIHVNQQPTYASKYPPGQGIFLAIGILVFGHPWYGVLLSVGLMCACICWMIQGWLPPQYGLLGGLAAALQFSGESYWINSYWGGAVAGAGGALVLGALPRLLRRPTPGAGITAAVGAIVLLNTRPFEGSIVIAGCLVAFFWRAGVKGLRRALDRRVIVGAVLVLAVGTVGMGYYNLRLTGNMAELPYTLHQRRYGLAPVFWIQPPPAPANHVYRDPMMKRLWEWDAGLYRQAREDPIQVVIALAWSLLQLCGTGPMSVLVGFAMIGFGVATFDLRLRPAAAIGACFTLAVLTEKWIYPHYLAPAVALLFLFTAVGLRAVQLSRFRAARAGPTLVYGVMTASAIIFAWQNRHKIDPLGSNHMTPRFVAEDELRSLGGRHVVLVRYSSTHRVPDEYVYNGPDIDAQQVVWAIDLGAERDLALQRYYSDRTMWLLEPDSPHPHLRPYGGMSANDTIDSAAEAVEGRERAFHRD